MPRLADINRNVAAFLDTISFSEGTNRYGNDEGYNVLVGGSLFESYADHPRKLIVLSPKLKSTAAGRYQIMARYFNPYKQLLLLPDFGPESQDKIAIQMIKEQGALKPIIDGDICTAIQKCANIWASFPGAGYGQHEHKLDVLIEKYKSFGGYVSC